MSELPQYHSTARLRWSPLDDQDIDVIYRQFSDPDMCRYFSEPPCSYAEAAEIIQMYQHSNGRKMRWKLNTLDSGAFVGTCGFHYYDAEKRHAELGYDIWKAYWNQGYMREVLPALIALCVQFLQVDTLYVLVDGNNAASIAVATRAGFVASAPFRPIDAPTEICFAYRVTSPQVVVK